MCGLGFTPDLGAWVAQAISVPAPPPTCQTPRLLLDSLIYWSRVLSQLDPKDEIVARAVSTGAEQGMSLSLATANMLTLHPARHTADAVSARRIFLEDQFHQRGLHIVGLQETRSREAHKRLGRRYTSRWRLRLTLGVALAWRSGSIASSAS